MFVNTDTKYELTYFNNFNKYLDQLSIELTLEDGSLTASAEAT